MSDRHAPGRHRSVPLAEVDHHGLDRRQVLKLGGFAVLAAAGATAFGSGPLAEAAAPAAKWPGHKPGKIFRGASSPDLAASLAETGPIGVRRSFNSWSGTAAELKKIKADQAALRMPWSSFKPPSAAKTSWPAVASGKYDADIRARARLYATLSKPVIVTFNHEPHTDKDGDPAQFAKAWTRVHDIMKSETNLKNVVSVPIIGEWCYNPKNKNGHPEQYITEAVLSRCHFLGVDLYQTGSGQTYEPRVGRIITWLDARGHSDKMVGIGETGACNAYGTPNAAQWWTASWAWASAHTSRVGVISYFNTRANNNTPGANWKLNESAAKLAAFKASLKSAAAAKM